MSTTWLDVSFNPSTLISVERELGKCSKIHFSLLNWLKRERHNELAKHHEPWVGFVLGSELLTAYSSQSISSVIATKESRCELHTLNFWSKSFACRNSGYHFSSHLSYFFLPGGETRNCSWYIYICIPNYDCKELIGTIFSSFWRKKRKWIKIVDSNWSSIEHGIRLMMHIETWNYTFPVNERPNEIVPRVNNSEIAVLNLCVLDYLVTTIEAAYFDRFASLKSWPRILKGKKRPDFLHHGPSGNDTPLPLGAIAL